VKEGRTNRREGFGRGVGRQGIELRRMNRGIRI
jgi:hypothetical protein